MVAPTKGTLARLNSPGRLANAGIKSSAILAVMALCVASVGVGKAAASGIAEPAQTAPVAANDQAKPAAKPTTGKVTATKIDPAREVWRNVMLKINRSKEGCATARYPDQQWHEVECKPAQIRPVVPPKGIHLLTVGGGGPGAGPSLAVLNGSIMQGEGSFDKVQGVTSEKGNGTSNSFTLQLNTNPFTTSTCNGALHPDECMGWVQFIYDSSGHYSEIQYWLLFYRNPCPAGWQSDKDPDGSCLRDSRSIATPAVTIADLRGMKLYGSIGGEFGNPYDDVVAIEVGGLLYAQWSGDPIAGATTGWQAMEFNVFGPAEGGRAVFNPGSTIVVRDSILIGTETGVVCSDFGWTGEMNSLTVTNKPPLVAAVGPPSLVFGESNAKDITPPGGCANAAVIQGTNLPVPIKPIIAHRP